jgi:predicted RNA-binding protein YlqC (UPF0109 family)
MSFFTIELTAIVEANDTDEIKAALDALQDQIGSPPLVIAEAKMSKVVGEAGNAIRALAEFVYATAEGDDICSCSACEAEREAEQDRLQDEYNDLMPW